MVDDPDPDAILVALQNVASPIGTDAATRVCAAMVNVVVVEVRPDDVPWRGTGRGRTVDQTGLRPYERPAWPRPEPAGGSGAGADETWVELLWRRGLRFGMTTKPTIRRARVGDLPGVVRLLADDELGRARERVVDPLPPSYAAAFREIDRDPRHELVVVDDRGEVVGVAQLSFVPSLTHQGGERAQIEGVRVASTRRGEGIGRLLFDWLIERAESRGCRVVQLTTDKRRPEARRFYESLGFGATHEGMKLALPRTR